MRISAIICEYNPFHNGHLLHIKKTREQTKCDFLICLMSGNFTQRGEPAILDKFKRAEIAVKCGADIVLELPTAFAINNAEIFARGAVRILNSIKQVTHLSFGSECADVELLEKTANFFINEPELFKQEIKFQLKKGHSLNLAKNNAIATLGYKLAPFLPNNILGIEYLKALKLYNSSIKPFTIEREAVDHNDTSIERCFGSSSAIRKCLDDNAKLVVKEVVPSFTYEALENCLLSRNNAFSNIILSSLRTTTKQELSQIFDVNEGIENSIIDKSRKFTSLFGLLNELETRRYSKKRIRRIILNNLFSITKARMNDFFNEMPYLRVLAIDENKTELLKILRENDIKTITRKADFNQISKSEILRVDTMASDIYAILTHSICVEETSGIIKVRLNNEQKK